MRRANREVMFKYRTDKNGANALFRMREIRFLFIYLISKHGFTDSEVALGELYVDLLAILFKVPVLLSPLNPILRTEVG